MTGRPAIHVTLEQLATMLDDLAEDANRHHLVGTHNWLAILLLKECGRQTATRIMRRIAEQGGLHAISE